MTVQQHVPDNGVRLMGGDAITSTPSFEIEEEFDLAALGFTAIIEAPSPNVRHAHRRSKSGGDDEKTGIEQVEIVQGVIREEPVRMMVPTRPASALRPSIRGRYISADWEPKKKSVHDQDAAGEKDAGMSENGGRDGVEDWSHSDIAAARLETLDREVNGTLHLNAEGGSALLAAPATSDNQLKNSGPAIAPGSYTSIESRSASSARPPRSFAAKLVVLKRPGRRTRRLGIKIIRPPPLLDSASSSSSRSSSPAQSVSPPPPAPPSDLTRDIVDNFFRSTYDVIIIKAKEHNTTGHLLPSILRDFFPALADRRTAVQLANEVRMSLDLPLLSDRTDRVALQRALAHMRERLYVEVFSALVLPLAPVPKPAEEVGDRPSLSLTPTSLQALLVNLPKAFPHEKAAIKAFFAAKNEHGEKGDVVWTEGTGRMAKVKAGDGLGIGYRGESIAGGDTHIFVDHSNILHGLLHSLYSDTRPLPPRHARILSLPCLSLLLRRSRPTPPGTLHLVASSPLHQDLDPLVRLGWQVSVLKRVEVYQDEVVDHSAGKLVPKATKGLVNGHGPNASPKFSSPTPQAAAPGLRRYKEQGVDEILTLKLLQTVFSDTGKGKKIVLATGDARGGQFNSQGFLGAVRHAVNRGWHVELWSFSAGLSRMWRDTARKEGWDGNFKVYLMDDWKEWLVDVNEDAVD